MPMTKKMRGKVLVIDDDRVASDIIVKTLLPRGLDVSVVANPDRGVEKAQEDSPDLIFISLFFPGSNGLKVSKRIHSLAGLEKVPVVMLISYKGELDPKYTLTIGIIDVLVKPLKPDEIISKTIKAIGREAFSEPSAGPRPSSEEKGLSGTEGLLSVPPAEEEPSRPPDFSPAESLHAVGGERDMGLDETEEFLRGEAEEEARVPAGEAPAAESGREQLSEEGGADSMLPCEDEEEITSGEPGKFFAGKGLLAVAIVCAMLMLGVGAYGLKKFLSRTEKVAQSRQAPSGRDAVQKAAGRPTVPAVGAPQGGGKQEAGSKEADIEKKETGPHKENIRPASPLPLTLAEGAGKKDRTPEVSRHYGFSVQVGAFSSEKNASSLVEELNKKGYDAFAEKEGVKPVYRVLVGSFPDERKASEQAKALQKDGLKTIIRRGKG